MIRVKNSSNEKLTTLTGTHADLIKTRKKELPVLEDAVNEFLADYDGGLLAISKVVAEGGNAAHTATMVIGVDGLEGALMLSKASYDSAFEIISQLKKSGAYDYDEIISTLKELNIQLGDEEDEE